jgi:hypothetical protein
VNNQDMFQSSSPIIVNIDQPKPDDAAGLADVLLGSLGLTGVIVLLAVVAAALFAGILIWLRSRSSQWSEPPLPH